MFEQGISVTGKGPVVIFLHSSLSSSNQWQKLAQVLSKKFTCVNVDLLGYGNARDVENEADYNFSTEIGRIKNVISEMMEPNEKYHLIGHSCGGAIALKMAVEHPEHLLSLAIYEPVAFHLFKSSNVDCASDIFFKTKQFAESLLSLDKSSATKMFVDFWNGDGFFEALPEKAQQMMSKGIDKVNLDFNGIFNEEYSFEALFNIHCPCLVLYGLYSPDASKLLSKYIVKHLTNVQTEEIPAGHMGPISHGKIVNSLIIDFYQRQ